MTEKRAGLIVEGQTEAIFLRQMLVCLYPAQVEILMLRLGAGGNARIPKGPHGVPHDSPKYRFTIVDAQGDGGVMNAMGTYGKDMLGKGFDLVLGLRDMYCTQYDEEGRGKIDPAVTLKLKQKAEATLNFIDSSGRMQHFFAVMEIEAWLLALNSVLQKIDARLTEEEIKRILGLTNEATLKVETYYKPTQQLKQIYESVNKKYDKSLGCIEGFAACLSHTDLEILKNSAKTDSFNDFYDTIRFNIG